MIIFGRRSSKVAAGHITATCHCCRQKEQQTFQINNDYMHIYWIPFFPLSKTYLVYCPFCRNVFKDNQISIAVLDSLKETSASIKRPLWHWAGLMILGGLMVFGMLS